MARTGDGIKGSRNLGAEAGIVIRTLYKINSMQRIRNLISESAL